MNDKIFETAFKKSFSSRIFELFIFPTEQCNFRCTYCYEDFKIGRMQRPVVRGIKNFLGDKSSSLELLRLQWFGGEPLVAFDIIEEIGGHAYNLYKNNPRLNLEGVITTNGYKLNAKNLERLVNIKVNTFQISLDGPKKYHDKTRILYSKKPTFDKIYGNLINARKSDYKFKIIIRLHLTPENISEMPSFIRQLKNDFLFDNRFVIHIVPVGHLGGPNDDTFETLSSQKANEVKEELMSIVNLNNNNADQENLSVCYAAKPNSLIIRADGRIAKCTVALSDPRNSVGKINEDGTLEFDQDYLRLWLKGWENRSAEELHCPLERLGNLDFPKDNKFHQNS